MILKIQQIKTQNSKKNYKTTILTQFRVYSSKSGSSVSSSLEMFGNCLMSTSSLNNLSRKHHIRLLSLFSFLYNTRALIVAVFTMASQAKRWYLNNKKCKPSGRGQYCSWFFWPITNHRQRWHVKLTIWRVRSMVKCWYWICRVPQKFVRFAICP